CRLATACSKVGSLAISAALPDEGGVPQCIKLPNHRSLNQSLFIFNSLCHGKATFWEQKRAVGDALADHASGPRARFAASGTPGADHVSMLTIGGSFYARHQGALSSGP